MSFEFTIYNSFSGFMDELGQERLRDSPRNLGVILVASGTIAMVLAVWSSWSTNAYLAFAWPHPPPRWRFRAVSRRAGPTPTRSPPSLC